MSGEQQRQSAEDQLVATPHQPKRGDTWRRENTCRDEAGFRG
jgi:hypothetical protein